MEREVYIRGFQPKVKVVVMKGAKEPIILMSTDITLTAIQIIEIYGSRFSIELAIRDLKQHFGLGDYQCYLGIAIDRFVQLACVAYCLFRALLVSVWKRGLY
ncbi:transposase [Microcystis sp. BLCC-F210]|uniref:transposase n=1 Tax=Microcystis sp. BLCC-F210 TaxID=3342751 RepID=UPI0035C88471